MTYKLHKLDSQIHTREHVEENDLCAYFLEKESEGYSVSHANNIIYNFKKPVSKKSLPEWHYKKKAIHEISIMFNTLDFPPCILIPAATSKPRSHTDWDDRLDQVVDSIVHPNVTKVKALDTISPQKPAHEGGSRNIDEIKNFTSCLPLDHYGIDTVFILDDVLTTGAHFKAWKQKILEDNPNIKNVIGLFIALHLWKSVEPISIL